MPKPTLSSENKRNKKRKVGYNSSEDKKLIARAKAYRAPVARFIRELTLSDEVFQIISHDSKKAAERTREIGDLINRLYIERIKLKDNNKNSTAFELQADSSNSSNNFTEEETFLWCQIIDQLRELNAELLGYADTDN